MKVEIIVIKKPDTADDVGAGKDSFMFARASLVQFCCTLKLSDDKLG